MITQKLTRDVVEQGILPADKADADQLLAQLSDETSLSARLDAARRMIEVEGKVSEGARLVRELAEQDDLPEAWKYMLECHEKGVGPFKTNKFRRAAKAALTRIETGEPRKEKRNVGNVFVRGGRQYVTSLPVGEAEAILSMYERSKG